MFKKRFINNHVRSEYLLHKKISQSTFLTQNLKESLTLPKWTTGTEKGVNHGMDKRSNSLRLPFASIERRLEICEDRRDGFLSQILRRLHKYGFEKIFFTSEVIVNTARILACSCGDSPCGDIIEPHFGRKFPCCLNQCAACLFAA